MKAGNTATLHSGGNTTLAGAVVAANRVKADVAGSLAIVEPGGQVLQYDTLLTVAE